MEQNDSTMIDPAAEKRLELSWLALTALVVVVCTAFSSQMVMPLWVGALIDDYALPADVVGTVASIEFAGVAIISLLVATRVHKLNVRTLSTVGIVCLIVGNGASVFATDMTGLTLCRSLAGLGKGLVVAGIFSMAARTVNPTRAFAILNGSYAAFSAGFFLVIPFFIARHGASGAFAVMFVITVAGALMLPWIPTSRAKQLVEAIPTQSPFKLTLSGVLILSSLVVMWAANGVVWTYVERIGVQAGLQVSAIGAVLSVSAILAIAGPGLAHFLHTRHGYLLPLTCGLVLKIVIAIVLCNVLQPAVFVAAAPFFNLAALFIVPYLMGLMSLADPSGRLAAAGAAAMTAGGSLGAFTGGTTLESLGIAALSGVSALLLVAVIGLVAIAVTRMQKHEAASQAA